MIALYIEIYVCGGLRGGRAEEWGLAVHTNTGLQRQHYYAHYSLAVAVCADTHLCIGNSQLFGCVCALALLCLANVVGADFNMSENESETLRLCL